jgi:hypothetical protein
MGGLAVALAAWFTPPAAANHSPVPHEWYGWYEVKVDSTIDQSDSALGVRTLKGTARITIPKDAPVNALGGISGGLIATEASFNGTARFDSSVGYCNESSTARFSLSGTHGQVDYGSGLGTEIRFDPTNLRDGSPVGGPAAFSAGYDTAIQTVYSGPPPDGSCPKASSSKEPTIVSFQHLAVPDGVANPSTPEICGQLKLGATPVDSGCQEVQKNNVDVHTAFGSFPGTATWNFSSGSDACPGDSPDLHSVTPDGCPGFVVTSIGDSVASGEGNPPYSSKSAKRCHRSQLAGPTVAFQALQQTAPSRFDSERFDLNPLACSGASVDSGLIGRYEGIGASIPRRIYRAFRALLALLRAKITGYGSLGRVPLYPDFDDQLPPQLDQGQLPAVDAVLISIGANDLGVIQMLTACGTQAARQAYRALSGKPTLPSWGYSCAESEAGRILLHNIGKLSGHFADLNRDLEARGVPADHVYVTEYFDPTRDSDGDLCATGPGHLTRSLLTIHRTEDLEFASTVVTTLNTVLESAAVQYGWNYIGGIADNFSHHGYCAGSSRAHKSWIVGLGQSILRQRDVFGTLHPNEEGQRCYATHIWSALYQPFYGVPAPESMPGSLLEECA